MNLIWDLPDHSPPPSLQLAGGWTRETLQFSDRTLHLWCPADTDAVLEHQLSTGDDTDPFWCYLWPTARILAQQVLTAKSPLPQRVLEAGCGIGLVGLAALAAGVSNVTFQDLQSAAVELALHNAQTNGFAARAVGQVADWRAPSDDVFDWILASDILYDRSLHRPLLKFLEAVIPPNRTRPTAPSIWIGDPGRSEAEDFLNLAKKPFHIELFDANDRQMKHPLRGQYQRLVLRPYAQ
ncbi:MAG: 50S ribosomal protein L11 methyltransferase [Cyanobacteria bacterium P01_D01_bin.44]